MLKTTFTYNNKQFTFCSNSRENRIFKFHSRKLFFEHKELEYLKDFVDRDSVILEVGANVGNHAVFYEAFLSPKKIILVEPMVKTIKFLKNNIKLNNCQKMDVTNLGIGISLDRKTYGYRFPNPNNLGGATLVPGKSGTIKTKQIDDIISSQVDFIKIDVEHMEIEALKSAIQTINKYKPKIFIEVTRCNIDIFNEILKQINYKETHKIECIEYINFFIEYNGDNNVKT